MLKAVMDQPTILEPNINMYTGYDFEKSLNTIDVNNKLFCTFVNEEFIDEQIRNISSSYDIMYNKILIILARPIHDIINSGKYNLLKLSSRSISKTLIYL